MNLFVCAGAMKAGTTWLYSHLMHHNQLYFTPEKEIHYLNDFYLNGNILSDENRLKNSVNALERIKTTKHIGLYKMYLRWYAMYSENIENFNWYERIFSLNKTKKYNCDFSNLTCHLNAENWSDLRSKVDTLKVIYILRDPLKRYWSHIKFHKNVYLQEKVNFNDLTEKEFKDFFSKDFVNLNGKYALHLKNMQKTLNAKEFNVFIFEDMVNNPSKFFNSLFKFLKIDNNLGDGIDLNKVVNASEDNKMPQAFLNVITPYVQKDLKQLADIGFKTPKSWNKL